MRLQEFYLRIDLQIIINITNNNNNNNNNKDIQFENVYIDKKI